MIQIRNNVFETNSSSAHTIAIKKKDEYDYDLSWYYYKNDNTTLDFRYFFNDIFGRGPFEILCTTSEKLPYFVCAFGYQVMKDVIIRCHPTVRNIIKKEPKWEYDNPDMKGGIDHQSVGMLQHFIKEHNLTIEEALFNNKYIIIIDGDESNVWNRMKAHGLLSEDIEDIEKPMFEYYED